jgi:tetratricopeptide (TPR) repeat protein
VLVAAGDRAGDPNAGRWAVAGVGVLGLVAIVGYGMMKSRDRVDATAPGRAQPAAQDRAVAAAPIADLTARARAARLALDVRTLVELDAALARAIEDATMAPKAAAARLERVDVLATLALEASIRGGLAPQEAEATAAVVKRSVSEGRALLSVASDDGADPGRLRAAAARFDLAAGESVADREPMVLLPTYRDTELRLAVLAEPLWRPEAGEEPMGEPALDDLVRTLRAQPRSVLLDLLLAAALAKKDDRDGAVAVLGEVLTEVPGQPTAAAMRAALGDTRVAMADPALPDVPTDPVPIDPTAGTVAVAEPRPPAPEPAPEAAPEPEPEPETKTAPPEPEPAPEAAPEPIPEPEPVAKAEPTPPEPEPEPKPKPTAEPKPRAKPSSDFDSLLAEGCKLARGSDPEKGLKLLQKAHDLKPGGTKVTLCMAEAHAKLGRDASARALCDRVLRSAPNNKQANLLMAKLEDAKGNKTAAVKHYRRVLESDPENATAKSYVEKNG